MGLLILMVVGAILGWVATIILQVEDGRGILTNAVAGVFGSLVAGIVAGKGSIFGAVSGMALLWGVFGALVTIAALNLVRRRAFR